MSIYKKSLFYKIITNLYITVGIHAIFGGFIAGLIVPHEHDLSIKITEKIEDLVNIIFLPLVSILKKKNVLIV